MKTSNSPDFRTGKEAFSASDLPDNEHDLERMKNTPGLIDMPEVKDIPGQERYQKYTKQKMENITIASSDEEGDRIWDEGESEEELASDISAEELELLARTAYEMPGSADEDLRRVSLEDTDDDGDPLNEESFATSHSGAGLDIPGAELDDANEEIGEEDEENNSYSRADTG